MSRQTNYQGIRNKLASRMQQVAGFMRADVWQDPEEAGQLKLLFYQTIRVFLLTINRLRDQMILLRASALSYSTLLAIIPLLAIAFSMMKGLGVHSRIEHLLVNYLTAEQEEVTGKIIEYISKTDFKALGAFGTGLLIIAVLMMLSNVERTFNDLWGVTRDRRIARKISDYISVLILGPLLMVIATAMMTTVSSHTLVQTLSRYEVFEQFFVLFNTILPHAALWIAFTAMYILMPNTRVRFLPALIAGIICGSIWEFAFRIYTDFNIGVARYNTIYGTFAALPIFIIWLYISWVIVLIGAQMSYAIQNVRAHQQRFRTYSVGQEQREEMAVNIMLKIVEQFHHGKPPLTPDTLSKSLSIPVRLVREIIDQLSAKGLVQELYADDPRFQPAKNPGLISALDVCKAMRSGGEAAWHVSEKTANQALEKLIQEKQSTEAQQLGTVSMLDLVNRSNGIAKD
ncbi:MAG: YihY/virulence factor BrkB family protein [Desulfobacterales bacterium]|nr:YihY/virulence factor BrkB family protein [Desulfobacterales bacterium]